MMNVKSGAKIVFLGLGPCGKTSIIKRAVGGDFVSIGETIGANIFKKQVVLEDHCVSLIWIIFELDSKSSTSSSINNLGYICISRRKAIANAFSWFRCYFASVFTNR